MISENDILTYISTSNWDELQGYIEKVKNKGNVDDIYALAEILTEHGLYSGAIVLFEILIKKVPDDSLKIKLAEILIEEAQEENAILCLEAIDETSDSYVASLILLADCYDHFGMVDVCLSKLHMALEYAPSEPIVIFALAETYFTNESYDTALLYYKQLTIEVINNIVIIERIASCLFNLGRYEESLEIFLQRQKPDDVNWLFQHGVAAFSIGDFVEAQRQFQVIINKMPDYEYAYYYLAKSLQQLDDVETAITYLRQGLLVSANKQSLYILLVQLLVQEDNVNEAITTLEEAINHGSHNEEILLTLAKLYLQNKEFQKVIKLLNDFPSDERDVLTHWLYASAFFALGDTNKAEQHYAAALLFFAHDDEFMAEYNYFLTQI